MLILRSNAFSIIPFALACRFVEIFTFHVLMIRNTVQYTHASHTIFVIGRCTHKCTQRSGPVRKTKYICLKVERVREKTQMHSEDVTESVHNPQNYGQKAHTRAYRLDLFHRFLSLVIIPRAYLDHVPRTHSLGFFFLSISLNVYESTCHTTAPSYRCKNNQIINKVEMNKDSSSSSNHMIWNRTMPYTQTELIQNLVLFRINNVSETNIHTANVTMTTK